VTPDDELIAALAARIRALEELVRYLDDCLRVKDGLA